MTTVLVTRPQPDADVLAAKLHEKNFTTLIDPLFKIEFSSSPPERKDYQALLATSRNAIRALAKTGGSEEFLGFPLFAVGEETELAARDIEFKNVHVADHCAQSLARLILETCAPERGPLLYLAGNPRKPELEKDLSAQSFNIRTWEGYTMQPLPALHDETLAAFMQKKINAVMLFSERAGAHFLQLARPLGGEQLNYPAYICLSPQVARPLLQMGLNALAPKAPRLHAMIELIEHKNH